MNPIQSLLRTWRSTWNNPLRRKFVLLRETVILLGMMEYLGLGGGIISASVGNATNTALFACLLGASYYISSRLAYRADELLVRLQIREENKT